MTEPTAVTPVEADPAQVIDRLDTPRASVPEDLLREIADSGAEVTQDDQSRLDAGRDWWPLGIAWAARGQVAARPAAVVRPSTTEQVSATLASCAGARVPVTPVAGRSGVCGGAVPVFGGIALDLTALVGAVVLDETSLLADVPAGIFGPDLEATLRTRGSGYTLGHFPQSMALSTVGGWLACRSAGQFSTRYGKIEDMVVGLEVVLADGRIVHTEGRGPRAATGPNLSQLFVGCEGTLGVITKARLAVHPLPAASGRRAYGFRTFASGLDACRRILRRGANPAVLRLYDSIESARHFELEDTCVLVVLDEADPGLLAATLAVVDEECAGPIDHRTGTVGLTARSVRATSLSEEIVGRWMTGRNDVSALAPLWRSGVVVDTAEVSGRWAVLPGLADHVLDALRSLPGTIVASVHQSHSYRQGACLYFTFAGRSDDGAPDVLGWQEDYYRRAWDELMAAVQTHGAAISHHHGIGLNRGRFMHAGLGSSMSVLEALKGALDPWGVLNPGKLGLPTTFGEVPWP